MPWSGEVTIVERAMRVNNTYKYTQRNFVQDITGSSGYIISPHFPFDYCYPPNEAHFISTDGVDGQRSFSRSGNCVENANLISGSHPQR